MWHKAAVSNGAVSLTLTDGPINEELMEKSLSVFNLVSKEKEELYTHKVMVGGGVRPNSNSKPF